MFKKYLEQPVVRELLVVGGQSSKDQIGALREGVDIVVATPGSTFRISFIGMFLTSYPCHNRSSGGPDFF